MRVRPGSFSFCESLYESLYKRHPNKVVLEDTGYDLQSTQHDDRGWRATWVYPHALPDGRLLGDLPVNLVTREMLGAVIHRVREAGRSMAIVEGLRNPLRGYYAELIETKSLLGPNPAGDLKSFVGKRAHRKTRSSAPAYFSQQEGPQLVATARALFPRWSPFILTGLVAGLRWGESAALIQRTSTGGAVGFMCSGRGAPRLAASKFLRTARAGTSWRPLPCSPLCTPTWRR